DLVFATDDTEALAHVKSKLQKRHTCTDLGELTSYLALRITRDRAHCTITLTQSHMVQQVLQRFGFTYSLPPSTPLPTGHSLSAPPSDESVEPSGPYPELVGYLMYLMTCTRPDLAYPLSLLARYVAPGRHRKVHCDVAKRVLRYLCSTSGMGLMLGGRARVVLTGHADASWVDDLATQRSSRGYTISLGSGSVSWRSTRSSSVLSSICEAEIYAGAMAAQELRWLTYLLTDLGEAPHSPPVLLRGDLVIHPELALPFLTGLVTSCFHTCTHLLPSSFTPSVDSDSGGSGGGSGSGGGGSASGRGGAVQRGGFGGGQSAEGECYLCVPPDPDIEAALPGTAPAEAVHTFTLHSGASRYFFGDSTTLTALPAPVPFKLADPSGGPVLARSSTILPCPAVPSGSLSGLHLPSFSTNLTGPHLATFTRRPGSSLYTLTTEPPQVAASAQVSASGPIAVPYSCCLLSHQTLLWHHRLGHPSLPRLRGMHSHLLVSGLPSSLPPLLPSPAPPYLPCVEGQHRAAPHSSSVPPTIAPLQTIHVFVWGPTCVSGQGRERYFMLVVDDYTRYTTVFPLRSKGEVPNVSIPWIRAVRLGIRERFREDLPVLRMHSDRGGEFSSNLLRDFCHGEGILQSFTLPVSPQQNGVAESRTGLVMEVTRTSMIHAAAPHFLWPFMVRYAGHQLNLWPRVSLPETLPTLR
ncbi:unnamed protein product, partial [Closterium sp. NIES-54]